MWEPRVQQFSAPAKVLLCSIAYFAHTELRATAYGHNYKWRFDINRNGNVAHDEITFDTPDLHYILCILLSL